MARGEKVCRKLVEDSRILGQGTCSRRRNTLGPTPRRHTTLQTGGMKSRWEMRGRLKMGSSAKYGPIWQSCGRGAGVGGIGDGWTRTWWSSHLVVGLNRSGSRAIETPLSSSPENRHPPSFHSSSRSPKAERAYYTLHQTRRHMWKPVRRWSFEEHSIPESFPTRSVLAIPLADPVVTVSQPGRHVCWSSTLVVVTRKYDSKWQL